MKNYLYLMGPYYTTGTTMIFGRVESTLTDPMSTYSYTYTTQMASLAVVGKDDNSLLAMLSNLVKQNYFVFELNFMTGTLSVFEFNKFTLTLNQKVHGATFYNA